MTLGKPKTRLNPKGALPFKNYSAGWFVQRDSTDLFGQRPSKRSIRRQLGKLRNASKNQ